MNKNINKIINIAVSFVFLCGFSLKGPAVEKAEKGNQYFKDGKYDKALEEYKNAQVDDPESPYLHYNIGTSLIQQNKHDEAAAEMNKVQAPNDKALEAKKFYNLGVSKYRQAEQKEQEKDLQGAADLLKEGIDANIQSMRLNPHDLDPKFNVEKTRIKREQILEELKKQPQQDNKDQQNKDEENKEDQKQQDQQDQNKQDQQQQDQNQQSDQQDKQDQQKQDQQKQDDQQQKEEEKQDQQSTDQQKSDEQKEESAQQQQAKPGEMSKEDAERILNSIPDEERKALQEYLLQKYKSEYPDMNKDW